VKIRFPGVPLEHIDQLCSEEEIVKVSISTFKREIMGHYDGSNNGKTTIEEVQTGGWGCSIRSSKDLIQFVEDDKDEYNAKPKNEYSDKIKEKFR
jgi:aminopeptidase-like protein